MAEIIQFPHKPKSAPKPRSRRKGPKQAQPSNVVDFPPPRRPYSIDVISEQVVDGMVLIEACISVAALEALMSYLGAS
jgi:hypothetical protein